MPELPAAVRDEYLDERRELQVRIAGRLRQDMDKLVGNGDHADLVLVTNDGKKLPAHSALLKQRAPGFHRRYIAGALEQQAGAGAAKFTVNVKDTDHVSLRFFLLSVYTDDEVSGTPLEAVRRAHRRDAGDDEDEGGDDAPAPTGGQGGAQHHDDENGGVGGGDAGGSATDADVSTSSNQNTYTVRRAMNAAGEGQAEADDVDGGEAPADGGDGGTAPNDAFVEPTTLPEPEMSASDYLQADAEPEPDESMATALAAALLQKSKAINNAPPPAMPPPGAPLDDRACISNEDSVPAQEPVEATHLVEEVLLVEESTAADDTRADVEVPIESVQDAEPADERDPLLDFADDICSLNQSARSAQYKKADKGDIGMEPAKSAGQKPPKPAGSSGNGKTATSASRSGKAAGGGERASHRGTLNPDAPAECRSTPLESGAVEFESQVDADSILADVEEACRPGPPVMTSFREMAALSRSASRRESTAASAAQTPLSPAKPSTRDFGTYFSGCEQGAGGAASPVDTSCQADMDEVTETEEPVTETAEGADGDADRSPGAKSTMSPDSFTGRLKIEDAATQFPMSPEEEQRGTPQQPTVEMSCQTDEHDLQGDAQQDDARSVASSFVGAPASRRGSSSCAATPLADGQRMIHFSDLPKYSPSKRYTHSASLPMGYNTARFGQPPGQAAAAAAGGHTLGTVPQQAEQEADFEYDPSKIFPIFIEFDKRPSASRAVVRPMSAASSTTAAAAAENVHAEPPEKHAPIMQQQQTRWLRFIVLPLRV